MLRLCGCIALLVLPFVGCSRDGASEPPPLDRAQYEREHESWLAEQRATLSYVLPITGIWTLPEGETPFGADSALPIALPAEYFPPRAGVFRRAGSTITIVPAARGVLRLDDGAALEAPVETDVVVSGPIRLQVTDAGDDRRWVMAIDTTHPAATEPPALESYAPDPRWRVPATFDAFDKPVQVRVPDVRGGFMEFSAVGDLVFRLNDQDMRLTAFGEDGADDLFVMFRDPTNQTTTYSGYRIVLPKAVKDGETTVIDFNFAFNPPCAYSTYTTCPLPPPQNRLPVAIEAGLKRLPSAHGFVPGT